MNRDRSEEITTDSNVEALDAGVRPKKSVSPLIFTTSKWHAQAHISGNETAIETGYPDPWEHFPVRVMKQVDYGIKNAGLDCEVIQYSGASSGRILGVVLFLYSGRNIVGIYANKHDRRAEPRPDRIGATLDRQEAIDQLSDGAGACATMH